MREAIGVGFDAEFLAADTEVEQHVSQLRGWLGAGLIGPDADILDDGGVPGLAQIGSAGQEGELAIGAKIEALEETEAKGVIAGEVIHALLVKHQETIEPLMVQRLQDLGDPVLVFAAVEMQSHWRFLTA